MEKRPGEEQEFTVVDKRAGRRSPEEGREATLESGRPAQTPEAGPAREPAPDLSSLFLMLGSSALVQLGEASDPVAGQPVQDLPHARFTIDLLGLLREKTEGHRSSEETRLLDDLLYDLRMRYLRITRRL